MSVSVSHNRSSNSPELEELNTRTPTVPLFRPTLSPEPDSFASPSSPVPSTIDPSSPNAQPTRSPTPNPSRRIATCRQKPVLDGVIIPISKTHPRYAELTGRPTASIFGPMNGLLGGKSPSRSVIFIPSSPVHEPIASPIPTRATSKSPSVIDLTRSSPVPGGALEDRLESRSSSSAEDHIDPPLYVELSRRSPIPAPPARERQYCGWGTPPPPDNITFYLECPTPLPPPPHDGTQWWHNLPPPVIAHRLRVQDLMIQHSYARRMALTSIGQHANYGTPESRHDFLRQNLQRSVVTSERRMSDELAAADITAIVKGRVMGARRYI